MAEMPTASAPRAMGERHHFRYASRRAAAVGRIFLTAGADK